MDLTPGKFKLILQLSADQALILHLSLDSLQLSTVAVLSLLLCNNGHVGFIQLMLPVLQVPPQLVTLTSLFIQLLLQLVVCLLACCHDVTALQTIIPVVRHAYNVQPHVPVLQ